MALGEDMLVSAVRYALGRSTYIVQTTADEVTAAWDDLSPRAQQVIRRDVQEALDGASAAGETLGMALDHQRWVRLLRDLPHPGAAWAGTDMKGWR